jgi:hypothetical protein
MNDFRKTLLSLTRYSKIIHSRIPGIFSNPRYYNNIEYLSHFLYVCPIPSKVKMYNITPGLFKDPITHIPLHTNTKYNVRTKMIVWDPLAYMDEHSHGNEDCFFQAILPGMKQTIYRDDYPDTMDVKTNEFSFINDTIGTHSIQNHLHSHTNVSFHLYIERA